MTKKELIRQVKLAMEDCGTVLVLERGRVRILKEGHPAKFFWTQRFHHSMLGGATEAWQRLQECYVRAIVCCWWRPEQSLEEQAGKIYDYFNEDTISAYFKVYGIDKDGNPWSYE